MHRSPISAIAAAALLAAAPLQAQSSIPPLESESFQIGTEGALCEAQGVMLGAARATPFDRKWALICSDVDRAWPSMTPCASHSAPSVPIWKLSLSSGVAAPAGAARPSAAAPVTPSAKRIEL